MRRLDFTGDRILVTGAAKGIGRAIAKLLHELGAYIIALDSDEEGLAALRMCLQRQCEVYSLDLRHDDELQRIVAVAGDIDMLVNVAGVAIFEGYLETTLAATNLQIDVNLKAAMRLTQLVAKQMVKRSRAIASASSGAGPPLTRFSIVNVSSQSSTVALSNHLVYSTSKAAVRERSFQAKALFNICYDMEIPDLSPPPDLPPTPTHTARPCDSHNGARARTVRDSCQRSAAYCRRDGTCTAKLDACREGGDGTRYSAPAFGPTN